MKKIHLVLLLGIIALAIFFRFYKITEFPGGLHPDEAANGLDINLMQQGHLQPFYERGNGREALFFYMLWAGVAMFGQGPWQHHVVVAAVGVAAVIMCFFVARKLFRLLRKNEDDDDWPATVMALLASFFMAVSSWHVTLSRTAFRANLVPLFAALTFWGVVSTFTAADKRKRLLWSIFTGAVFALGFYTYIAFRIMAPIMFMIIAWPFLADLFGKPRLAQTKKYAAAFGAFIIAFGIFIFPLASYFHAHPGSFLGRTDQVSIFNPDLNHGHLLGTLATVTKDSLLGFFTRGDSNWRHNVSGYPFLPTVVSPFFLVGLLFITLLGIRYFFQPRRRGRDWVYFLLTGWFWGMLIPEVTTAEGIPHGLRSIGVIPVVFIITAWGLYKTIALVDWGIAQRHFRTTGLRRKLVYYALRVAAVCFFIALPLQTYFLYFGVQAESPDSYAAFRSDLTPVSRYLNGFDSDAGSLPAGKIPADFNNRHTKNNTYLVLDDYSAQPVEYETAVDGAHPDNPKNQPYTLVAPQDSWKLSGLKIGDEVVFTQSTIFDSKKFLQYHPGFHLKLEYRNKFDEIIMQVYGL